MTNTDESGAREWEYGNKFDRKDWAHQFDINPDAILRAIKRTIPGIKATFKRPTSK